MVLINVVPRCLYFLSSCICLFFLFLLFSFLLLLLFFCSPPVRWGLLDFMSATSSAYLPPPHPSPPPPPPPAPQPCSSDPYSWTPAASAGSQCSPPELNPEFRMAVFPAGPQPPAPDEPCFFSLYTGYTQIGNPTRGPTRTHSPKINAYADEPY